MADLAGFDVIGELHIETIVDIINMVPITNPADGSNIYLLGGPFSVDLNANLGPLGVITVRTFLDATLQAVVHQPLARVVISLSGGSASIAGRTLSQMGGQVTASVSLGFALPPAGSALPGAPQVPLFLFGTASVDCVLDRNTRSMADAALGPGGADRLTSALCDALKAYLSTIGTQAIPALGFTVVPGVDSNDPRQLSAPPVVAWIDGTTLGVFGYYRAAATGGDVRAKLGGDLGQVRDEYFYGQPGAISTLPGRRIALLLSATAFEQVLRCPAVRNYVVRGLVERRDQDAWRTRIRDRDGAAVLAEQTQAHFFEYLQDEFSRDPFQNSQTIPADIDRAKARVQADADAVINDRAHTEEDAWLDNTPEGQQAISTATPPPCGSGAVQITRENIGAPGEQSDLVAMLRRIDVRLGDGRITVHYEADATLEDLFGDAKISVTGDMDIFVTVSELGSNLGVSFDLLQPTVDVGATGLTGQLLDGLKFVFSEGDWRAIMAFVALILQEYMANAIAAEFPQGPIPAKGLPQQPFPTRLAEIVIDPGSLLLLGLICRRPRWNELNPGLLVDATLQRDPAAEPPIHGKVNFPATEWGCPAVEFNTTRTFWDSTVSVRARLRDAPLPVTVLGWHIEIGNFSTTEIANPRGGTVLFLDPRPDWSGGEPAAAIATGHLTLSGKVNHPDSPIVLIEGAAVLGHLQLRRDVPVDVTGDPDNGWQLRFRGVDGNFYLNISVDVRDGNGTQWHGETFVALQGDQFELPAEYAQYRSDCDAKYNKWVRFRTLGMIVGLTQVQPGQPVMNGETREAVVIRTLVSLGNPAALRQLIDAHQRYGASILGQVGRVPSFTITQQQSGIR
jgi:hypothetical protein